MKQNDAELVRRTRQGDRAAFGELGGRYRQMVYGLCYHQVGQFEDAQDLAQEAFVAAYLDLPQLRDPARFAPWLRQVTVRVCGMWRRRQSVPSEPLEEAAELPAPENVEAEVERRELRAAVRRALAALPDPNRLVATLYYLDGLNYAEIGHFLDVPPTTVKGRLQRARKQLREEMMAMVSETLQEQPLLEDFTEQVLQTVLVVEDDLDLAERAVADLQTAGFDVLHRRDGQNLLDEIRRLKPRIVLLNEIMPGVNGFDVLIAMKADEELKHIPVIFVPCDSEKETIYRI